MTATPEITQLLAKVRKQEAGARDQLLAVLYDELRRLAHRQLQRRSGSALDTTALVHEAYLKLSANQRCEWQDRAHFMAAAAVTMRHILVDLARKRSAQKRGGDAAMITLDDAKQGGDAGSIDAAELLALDQALTALARHDERLSKLVELRFFGGLTVEETAEILELSERTVKREWRKARAFLYRTLEGDELA